MRYDIPQQNGFDALRWIAALMIVVSHYMILAETGWGISMHTREAVQFFFILSGMLTYRSFIAKPGTLSFYKRRARRILPAYLGVILFCFLVGVLFTELPLRQFFAHNDTGRYLFWNVLMLNRLQPTLPGVFASHVNPVMDGSLWTMKFEVAFYILLPLAAYFLRKCSQRGRWILFASAFLLLVLMQATSIFFAYQDSIWGLLSMRGASQAVCFLCGMMAWEAYDLISEHRRIVFPIALAVAVLSYFLWPVRILWPLVFTVLIVLIGTRCRPLNVFNRLPRITYELFLIHFPIVQSAVEIGLPERFGHAWAFAAVLVTSIFFAYLLHYLCEKLIKRL